MGCAASGCTDRASDQLLDQVDAGVIVVPPDGSPTPARREIGVRNDRGAG